MTPPSRSQSNAVTQLTISLRETSFKIENLQKEVDQLGELRKLANKIELILAQYEIRQDHTNEKIDRESQIAKEGVDNAKEAVITTAKNCQVTIAKLEKRVVKQEENSAALKLERAQEAAAMKKQLVITIAGIVTALITAGTAITVAIISASGG